MGALTAIETQGVTRPEVPGAIGPGSRAHQAQLRRASRQLALATPRPGTDPHHAGEPRSSSMTADVRQLPASSAPTRRTVSDRSGGSVRSAPLRLTRRGRIVLSCLIVAGVTIAALLLSLVASAGAQATNHGQARAGYQGMREVVVQPGQTLWSIASAAEPSADTRAVVQQIISVNSLAGTSIWAGQLLWVPQ
jgi:hypothetical protein